MNRIQNTSYYSIPLTALPPKAQEAQEKEAILADPRLAQLLNGKTVSSIDKVYEDITPRHTVTLDDGSTFVVDIIYLTPIMPGPVPFTLNFPDSI